MIDVSIAQWCFEHPYLTFFMFCFLCCAIGNFSLIKIEHRRDNNDGQD
jgi:hypothetical protein